MAKIFEEKSALTASQRAEIDRIEAKASGLRTTAEAAFLVSLAPYLTNEVITRNAALEIVIASGETVPDGYEGFAKGALFIKSDAADGVKALYENIGTNADCDFNKIGEITTAEIGDGQVTSAKLASSLDLSGKTIANLALQSGTPVNAVSASATLTVGGAITLWTHAASELVSDTTNVSNGQTVSIGATIYRFQDIMTSAFDVQIGASYDLSLQNLAKAINLNGIEGTDYYAGTTAHPDIRAQVVGATMMVRAKVPGTTANTISVSTTATHLAWPDTTLGGGAGNSTPGVDGESVTIDGQQYKFVDSMSEEAGAPSIANQVKYQSSVAVTLDNLKSAINATAGAGTAYSTATTAHPTVAATTNTDTAQTVAALTKGTGGNSLAVSETMANGSWGAANLSGGVAGTTAESGKVLRDTSYLYIAIATQGATDANWRRISLGSAF